MKFYAWAREVQGETQTLRRVLEIEGAAEDETILENTILEKVSPFAKDFLKMHKLRDESPTGFANGGERGESRGEGCGICQMSQGVAEAENRIKGVAGHLASFVQEESPQFAATFESVTGRLEHVGFGFEYRHFEASLREDFQMTPRAATGIQNAAGVCGAESLHKQISLRLPDGKEPIVPGCEIRVDAHVTKLVQHGRFW